jgi:tetratricopeptide (TPR) repeat protein
MTRVLADHPAGVVPRPGSPIAEQHNQKGVEFYESERYDEAIMEFQQAIALDDSVGLYHCNLAVAYGERAHVEQAIIEYRRAIALNPTDLTALLNLGYACNLQGRPEEARQLWQRIIDLAAHSPEAEEATDAIQHLDAP